MLALSIVDFAVQMAANHQISCELPLCENTHLANLTRFSAILLQTSQPTIRICFIMPTSLLYAIVFISPTIFHHIILAMTLFKSIKHLRITNAVGIGSIMRTIQRDHILYTLVGIYAPLFNLELVLIRHSRLFA